MKELQYLLEERLWFIGVSTGFFVAAIVSSTLFAFFALLLLAAATNADEFGVTGVGVTLMVSMVIARVVAGRFWQFAMVSLASTGSVFGKMIKHISEFDTTDSKEFCSEGNIHFIGIMVFLGVVFLSFFYTIEWTCETTTRGSGLMHTACLHYEPGPFRSLLVYLIRVMGGGFGVAGLCFLLVGLLELRFLWRGSTAQRRYRSSSLYSWLHPMASLWKDLKEAEQEDDEQKEGQENDE